MRLAVIPARLGATRLPGKPLADVAGLPLVVHVWRRVAGSGCFDRVLVATEDRAIAEVVWADGGDAVVTGPAASGTHRVAVAARGLAASLVVNVQGDLPTIGVDALEAVVRGLDRASIATVCAPLAGDPEERAVVKVAVDPTGLATNFSRLPWTGAHEHVGIYGFSAESLQWAAACPPSPRSRAEDLEQLAWMDGGLAIAVDRIAVAPRGIDTPEQLDALRARFQRGLERVPPRPDRAVYASNGLR